MHSSGLTWMHDTKARLDQGARIVEVLKQGQNAPVPVEKQVAVLYAVTKGILVPGCSGRCKRIRGRPFYQS